MISVEPLVSVITPVYNAEKYIFETIQGVINQSYKNWEMIIVDDCSSDSSVEIINEVIKDESRIKLIKSTENFGGPAKPRNIALDNAKGEYIAFLDADDVWLPSKLEEQVKCIKQNDVDLVHTSAYVIDEHSKQKGILKSDRIYKVLKYILKDKYILFYTNYININSVLMKKTNSLRFSEDKNLIALEDWNYWIDAQKTLNIYHLKKILLNYRVHSTSISDRGSDKGYRKALYMLSKLLLNKEVRLRDYFFSVLIHILKIIIK